MKHFFAYCFILLILLNVVGYNGLFFGLQYDNARSMRDKLDNGDYPDETSVTLKIPLALPYAYDRTEFDRVDGSFEFKNELYRLVEKRLENDTLTVVCVLDRRHGEIQNAFETFVRSFQDNAADQTSGVHTISLIKDYVNVDFSIQHATDGWSYDITSGSLSCTTSSPFLISVSVPPETALA